MMFGKFFFRIICNLIFLKIIRSDEEFLTYGVHMEAHMQLTYSINSSRTITSKEYDCMVRFVARRHLWNVF